MTKMNIRKGDKVKVIAGKDRGAESVVMRTIPETQRVVVEKVAIAKKHTRPTQQNPSGSIREIEMPIHVSNVMLVCPKCKAATRVGTKGKGKDKVRFCKKCGADID